MALRLFLLLLMALGLAGFGEVAWVATRSPTSHAAATTPPPPVLVKVLVASRPLAAGSLLKPEDITGKDVQAEQKGPDANADAPEVRSGLTGAMLRRSLAAGEMLRNADVLRPGDHGFLAAVLRPGMRAVTVAVDAVTGTAGLIWPGDHVDLILTESLSGDTVPVNRRVAAETVLADVRVIAIDQRLVQGAEAPPKEAQDRTVTLEVTPDQAQRVSVAVRLGRLSLAVRSAEPAATPAAQQRTGGTTWAGDVSPALHDDTPVSSGVVRVFQGAADGKEFRF